MRLSLTNVRRPTPVGRRLREDLRFKDENDLGVGEIYVAGLWTNLQIEIPNGEAERIMSIETRVEDHTIHITAPCSVQACLDGVVLPSLAPLDQRLNT